MIYPEVVKELTKNGIDKNNIIILIECFTACQYFDDVIKLNDNEVLIDCGCYDCTNDLEFVKRCPNYKKIIAFEPNEDNYIYCQKIKDKYNLNIDFYQCGAWNSKDILYFDDISPTGGRISDNGKIKISVNSIDNICKSMETEATYIKMDIEGSELEALKGAKETIINYKPKLAISVYHKPNDIIEIPLYINSLVPEYKFYLRHHSINGNDTVLYAII